MLLLSSCEGCSTGIIRQITPCPYDRLKVHDCKVSNAKRGGRFSHDSPPLPPLPCAAPTGRSAIGDDASARGGAETDGWVGLPARRDGLGARAGAAQPAQRPPVRPPAKAASDRGLRSRRPQGVALGGGDWRSGDKRGHRRCPRLSPESSSAPPVRSASPIGRDGLPRQKHWQRTIEIPGKGPGDGAARHRMKFLPHNTFRRFLIKSQVQSPSISSTDAV